MRSPESFDAFYASSRDRLLHETYALTGDLAAARTAVRDAFAVAWHHWRKVAILDDRETWMRPVAHGRARRRAASTRLWHRDKSLDPEVRKTLAALSKLTGSQRQLLVLTTLSPLSMRQIARVVGLPRADAERALQTATTQFALHRDVPTVAIRGLLDDLAAPLADVRWPRAPIVRRAGTARRRVHTTAGAALAAVVLVASGSLVATGAGAEPSSLHSDRAAPTVSVVPLDQEPASDEVLASTALLDDDQVSRFGPRLQWARTDAPEDPDAAIVLPCQREPYAGLEQVLSRSWDGTAETVRRTRARGTGKVRRKRVTRTVVDATQLVARSRDSRGASEAYTTTSNWFAACADPRTQLLATRRIDGVGDEAMQFRLRTWGAQPSAISVAVARTGRLVVTSAVRARQGTVSDRAALGGIAAAVNRLCGVPGAGDCAGRAAAVATAPVPAGAKPGLLTLVDLPPATAVRGPWVGTDAETPNGNDAATRCDRTSFVGKGLRKPVQRMFMFPQARNVELGLVQIAAPTTSPARARSFIETVRERVRSCGRANLGADVTTLVSTSTPAQDLHVWLLEIEINDRRTVPYLMAVQRDRNVVGQLTFIPDGASGVSRSDFVGVARRALDRLSDLEGHRG